MISDVNLRSHAPETGETATRARGHHKSRRLRRLRETQELKIRSTHRRRTTLTRGGVVGAFALAMLVYPIAGTVLPYAAAVEELPGVVVGESPSTAHAILGRGPQLVQSSLDAPTIEDVASAIAVSDRYTVSQYLPECDTSTIVDAPNGQLPASELCQIPGGADLRADAAVAFAEMNAAFKGKFGRDICVGEGYRSLSKQYATKASRGWWAATPGTSVHGYGLAIDLCQGDMYGETRTWLNQNAETWGWENPSWAKTTKYEPWHWEYEPATTDMDLYGSGYYSNGVSD